MSDDSLDFDDDLSGAALTAPSTKDLPAAVLANQIAIKGMRRRLGRIEKIAVRVIAAVIGGSVTVAGSVAAGAYYVGERTGGMEAERSRVEQHDERITYLEREINKRGSE